MHNDRGSQYNTDMAFEIYLNGYGIQQDLGGTSRCYGRQRTDGKLLRLLKKEKLYKDGAYKLTRKEVTTMIFCYVFVYYNRIRVYTTNPYGLPQVKYQEWKTEIPLIFLRSATPHSEK